MNLSPSGDEEKRLPEATPPPATSTPPPSKVTGEFLYNHIADIVKIIEFKSRLIADWPKSGSTIRPGNSIEYLHDVKQPKSTLAPNTRRQKPSTPSRKGSEKRPLDFSFRVPHQENDSPSTLPPGQSVKCQEGNCQLAAIKKELSDINNLEQLNL
ncbi:hypothetical protein CDAR_567411 [Caerostris darwini]|uniref:Uncharacterized protein n=1 Tax=Caerostris darwini TaxID=1538125 RepID=A0AAV4QWH8_9ARAC|nr:hypothetical protein CDAR_567411 [Caerostris darwini]